MPAPIDIHWPGWADAATTVCIWAFLAILAAAAVWVTVLGAPTPAHWPTKPATWLGWPRWLARCVAAVVRHSAGRYRRLDATAIRAGADDPTIRLTTDLKEDPHGR